MSQVLERAFKQFRDKVAATEILHIDVPQWPDDRGNPTIIYFMPLGALRTEIYSKVFDLIRRASVESAVDIVILRALNEDKTPIFKPINRIEMLKKLDPEVLLDIISKMGELDAAYSEKPVHDLEDIEKN
jgi:hypothetical protein